MSLSGTPPTLPSPFALGWRPDTSRVARARMLARGRYARVAAPVPPDAPPAMSLTRFRRRPLMQGGAGTCWVHAPTQLAEFTMRARGYADFDVCRMAVAYQGKVLEGGGNPSNGGNGIDALDAMTSEKGIGVAHESLWPYSDSWWELRKSPSQAVLDDARKCHLVMPVDVTEDDQMLTMIVNLIPTCIGIWWPFGWDDSQALMDRIGRGTYGHELLVCGYAQPGVLGTDGYWQLDNWHGLIYPPLTADQAAKVEGYTPVQPDRTSDFWVPWKLLATVGGYGDYERVSATDLVGLETNVVETKWEGLFL